jgi:hypothetical protein
VTLQEELTHKTIDILATRLKDYGAKADENGFSFLGVPSYDHLINGNNLKRFDQMLDFEQKLKDKKGKSQGLSKAAPMVKA